MEEKESVKVAYDLDNASVLSTTEQKLRMQYRAEYEALYETWKAADLQELITKQEAKNKETIQQEIANYYEKWSKEQTPLTQEELQQLLQQDYIEIKVPVRSQDGTKVFTIGELPQSAEIRFVDIMTEKLVGKVQLLSAWDQSQIDKPFEDKVNSFIGLARESLNLLPEAVAIVLNPYGKEATIDAKWVRDNLSSYRQWNIAEAQMHVNRIRDFLSRVSRSGQMTQTMLIGQNFQQLREAVH